MIRDILNVKSADDGRSIEFVVSTDEKGADEKVSVTLNDERFSVPVRLGPSEIAAVSIPLIGGSTSVRCRVVVVAEGSGATSAPTDLTLAYKEPGPRRKTQP